MARLSARPNTHAELLSNVPPDLAPIVEEVYRLWWWTVCSGKVQFASSAVWSLVNLSTTGIASVLAAATGVSALADFVDRVWIGTASLLAAVLAGLSALVSAREKAEAAADAGNAYIELRDDARQLLQIDLPRFTQIEAREALKDVTTRYHTINRNVPPPTFLARLWVLSRLNRKGLGRRTTELNRSWYPPEVSTGEGL